MPKALAVIFLTMLFIVTMLAIDAYQRHSLTFAYKKRTFRAKCLYIIIMDVLNNYIQFLYNELFNVKCILQLL